MILSLRGAVRDEAIPVFRQRLLRCARNDTWTLCRAVGVLSHSPKGKPTLLLLRARTVRAEPIGAQTV
jgi:hypothetical protein